MSLYMKKQFRGGKIHRLTFCHGACGSMEELNEFFCYANKEFVPLTEKPLVSPSFFFCHLLTFSQAHRLTPDFPDALFELLCTLQEGRRLNDQRCSFRLENGLGRRRCHSEPNATKPANRGESTLRGYTSRHKCYKK